MFHTQASIIDNELFAKALAGSSSAGESELKITIAVLSFCQTQTQLTFNPAESGWLYKYSQIINNKQAELS